MPRRPDTLSKSKATAQSPRGLAGTHRHDGPEKARERRRCRNPADFGERSLPVLWPRSMGGYLPLALEQHCKGSLLEVGCRSSGVIRSQRPYVEPTVSRSWARSCAGCLRGHRARVSTIAQELSRGGRSETEPRRYPGARMCARRRSATDLLASVWRLRRRAWQLGPTTLQPLQAWPGPK